MSRTYNSDRTGIASFIGHNDAASYLVEYEGRRHGMALHCIALHLYYDLGYEMCVLEYGFGSYWMEVIRI